MTRERSRRNNATLPNSQEWSPRPPHRGARRAGRETVPTWGSAAAVAAVVAGSRRPWLRRPPAAAPGNTSSSARPGSRRARCGRPGSVIGSARHVAGPGASLPGTCNPLPVRPAPRGSPGGSQAAPRARAPSPGTLLPPAPRPAPQLGLDFGLAEAEKPGARPLSTHTQGACRSPARAGKLFSAYFLVVLSGEGSFL